MRDRLVFKADERDVIRDLQVLFIQIHHCTTGQVVTAGKDGRRTVLFLHEFEHAHIAALFGNVLEIQKVLIDRYLRFFVSLLISEDAVVRRVKARSPADEADTGMTVLDQVLGDAVCDVHIIDSDGIAGDCRVFHVHKDDRHVGLGRAVDIFLTDVHGLHDDAVDLLIDQEVDLIGRAERIRLGVVADDGAVTGSIKLLVDIGENGNAIVVRKARDQDTDRHGLPGLHAARHGIDLIV